MIRMISRDWNGFWFSMRPATTLGLFRLIFGIMLMSWCVLMFPDLRTWYTEQGLLNLAAMRAWNLDNDGFSVFILRDWTGHVLGHPMFANVTSYFAVCAIFWIMAIASFTLTVGYKSRISSIVVAILLVSFHHRGTIILNGGDTLMRNMALLLVFADSGAAVSIDRLLRIKRGVIVAGTPALVESWPQRLMQLQLAAVYLSTVLSKLTGDEWRDGTAYYYSSQLTDLQRFSMHGLNLIPWFYVFGTYYTLFGEFSMGTLVFVRRLRPYALIVGLSIHAGIEYSMLVPLFSYTITSCYMNFVYPEWIDQFAANLHKRFARFTISLPQNSIPANAYQVVMALDSLKLINSGEQSFDSNPVIIESSLNRILWRLPIVWAATFVPLIVAILIRGLPSFLIATGIVWPLILMLGMRYYVKRNCTRWSSGTPMRDDQNAYFMPEKLLKNGAACDSGAEQPSAQI